MSSSTIDDIIERLHQLQAELEKEIDQLLFEKQQQFKYTLKRGKVRFEKGMRTLQRSKRVKLWVYLKSARLGHILSAPFIYSLLAPLLLMDLMVSLYQQVCFRIYGIPLVRRNHYIIMDRQHLAYLNTIEKINCIYCGYANGVIEYIREVAARTEQYWCPIKHARRSKDPHRLFKNFVEYGDADAYSHNLQKLRDEISRQQADTPS